MMGKGRFIISVTFALLALAACAPDASSRLITDDALIAPGVASSGPEVEPIIVGDRLMQAGEYELAISAYTRAIGRTGPTPELEQSIAAANINLGRLGQAEKSLRKLLRAAPEDPRLLNDLGVVLMERGETGEASRVFQQAFALDSGNSPEIRENLRVALAKMENPSYSDGDKDAFTLVRRGNGVFSLHQQDP